MTEKELRHLSKTEMLGIMLNQEREVNTLKDRICELELQLSDRSISIQEAGSIAEASLIINKVMEAAQEAADQYLFNIKTLSEKQYVCRQIQDEAEVKAPILAAELGAQCVERERQAQE